MPLLTPHDLRRIACAGLTTERSARRVYLGKSVRNLLRLRIARAAASLGLPAPPLAALHESGIAAQEPTAPLLSVAPSADEGKHDATPGAPRSDQ